MKTVIKGLLQSADSADTGDSFEKCYINIKNNNDANLFLYIYDKHPSCKSLRKLFLSKQ